MPISEAPEKYYCDANRTCKCPSDVLCLYNHRRMNTQVLLALINIFLKILYQILIVYE